MKKIAFGILLISLIITGGIFALAKKGGKDFAMNRESFRERIFDRVSKELNLSEEQKTEAKQILTDSKSRVEPLMQQLAENRKQAKELGIDGVYNEEKVQALANAQADLMKQLFIEKEKDKAQLFAILSVEQQEKAKQKMNDFEGRFGKRFQGGFKGAF